jgi:hypothetical protein
VLISSNFIENQAVRHHLTSSLSFSTEIPRKTRKAENENPVKNEKYDENEHGVRWTEVFENTQVCSIFKGYFGRKIIFWITYKDMPLYSTIRGTCDVKGMSLNARGYGRYI